MTELTIDELKLLKYSLFANWEMAHGIDWTVEGVNVPTLHIKLQRMLDDRGRRI